MTDGDPLATALDGDGAAWAREHLERDVVAWLTTVSPTGRVQSSVISFLYDDGSEAHFMDQETYEQFALPRTEVADELAYMLPSSTVQILQVNGKPSGLQLPASVELAVAETEPGVRGDTVSNVTKPATLETGAVVQVPLFVNTGERIKVDPREGRYISRA